MKRAQLNFAVDAAIALAFLVCAVTGILFLLPPGVIKALGMGMPGMLGVSFRAWHWLHDWSGVVATAGVLVHSALHYRWIVTMTRRTFGSEQTPAQRAKRARTAAPGAALATSARRDESTIAGLATRQPAGRAASPAGAAPDSYSTYRGDAARRRDQRRITRRRFLAAAAAGVGAAVLGGGLLSRLGATAADAQQGSDGAQAAGGAATHSGSGTTAQSAAGQAQSGGGTALSGGGTALSGGGTALSGGGTVQSGGTTSSAAATGSGVSSAGDSSGSTAQSGSTEAVLVSVDTSECIGCGRCLNVCPAGVFAWNSSGSRAVARNASQCIRCHRCLQTCPASAITVNG